MESAWDVVGADTRYVCGASATTSSGRIDSPPVRSTGATAGASAGASAPLGIHVLDVCSAPGSKACHLAELGAEVTAMDVSASRLARVDENAERLGLTIKTLLGDGRELGELTAENAFDLVLLDVPCSATGVMRRNPDVKVIRLKSDINQFAELQQALRHQQELWRRRSTGHGTGQRRRCKHRCARCRGRGRGSRRRRRSSS